MYKKIAVPYHQVITIKSDDHLFEDLSICIQDGEIDDNVFKLYLDKIMIKRHDVSPINTIMIRSLSPELDQLIHDVDQLLLDTAFLLYDGYLADTEEQGIDELDIVEYEQSQKRLDKKFNKILKTFKILSILTIDF